MTITTTTNHETMKEDLKKYTEAFKENLLTREEFIAILEKMYQQ